ncbi:glycoside hydrolase family 2 TIM barrel-domain containing protein [Paenibacillus phyllosphaerae]
MDAPYTDLSVIDTQVTQTVKRLRNHPSLIMWGGGNENGPHGGADEGLFLAGRRCRQFDPSRPFHRTDPWGGSVHNWNVYHGGEPLDASTRAMPSVMVGEYGIPSMTNRSSILKYMPEEALGEFPPTEESRGWKAHFHQFSLKDPIKVMRYGAYGPIRNWDDYIAYSQTSQGESIRYTAEMQRAGAGETASGFWYYKFTDLFPGHSWAVVDYYGTPKLSYYRAMQTSRPQSVFAFYEKMNGWHAGETFTASLHIANDTLEPLQQAKARAVLYDSRFKKLWSQEYDGITIEANRLTALDSISVKLPAASEIEPFLLAVSLHAQQGKLIAGQWYWFNAQPKTEELLAFEQAHTHNDNEYPGELAVQAFERYANLPSSPMRQLPLTQLIGTMEQQETGGTIKVRNIGPYPAIRVIIEGFPEDWDCYLADNDFGLYPGEERVIGFEAGSGQSMAGLTLGGWNTARITLAQS